MASDTPNAAPRPHIRWWQWPNVLALDAALVAVGWQQWFGWDDVGAIAGLGLGLSVWLTYLGDRWLDVRKLPPERIATVRHGFIRRHEKPLLVAWIAVLVLDVALAFTLLSPANLLAGLGLLLACILYTWGIQRRIPLHKELLVALIFTAGVACFIVTHWLTPSLVTALIALFLLCYANCVLIAFREREVDRRMGRSSIALRYPLDRKWAFRALLLPALLGIVLCFTTHFSGILITVCAVGLYHLGWRAKHIPVEVFRVLVDSVLILPWLVVLFWWVTA